jgi:starvation-inducible DNA-binding protein
MYEARNDLSPTTRRSVIEVLNEHLADAIDLQLQAKQAHWNIKGPNFVGLHELFDRVASQVASTLTTSRREPSRSVEWHEERSRQSQLREYPLEVGDWRAHVQATQDALATFGRGARKAIEDATALNDADTADLFTEISRGVDKSLWMVEAHIQDAPVDVKQLEERSASRGESQ